MLIGYMRVSKNDGSQVLDLQVDALMDSPCKPMQVIFFNELAVSEPQIKTAMPKFVSSNQEPFQVFDESISV